MSKHDRQHAEGDDKNSHSEQDSVRSEWEGLRSEWSSVREELPPFRWQNLLSFRMMMAAIFAGMIVGVPLSMVWTPLGWVALPVIVLVWLATGFTSPVRCPECRKQVKTGAERCHHCGVKVS